MIKQTERLSPVLETMALAIRDASLTADAELEWAVGGLSQKEFDELAAAVASGWGGPDIKRAVDVETWGRRQRHIIKLPIIRGRGQGDVNLAAFFAQVAHTWSRAAERTDFLLQALTYDQLVRVSEAAGEQYPQDIILDARIYDELKRRDEQADPTIDPPDGAA